MEGVGMPMFNPIQSNIQEISGNLLIPFSPLESKTNPKN